MQLSCMITLPIDLDKVAGVQSIKSARYDGGRKVQRALNTMVGRKV